MLIPVLTVPFVLLTEIDLAYADGENLLGAGYLVLFFENGTEMEVGKLLGHANVAYLGRNVTANMYLSRVFA